MIWTILQVAGALVLAARAVWVINVVHRMRWRHWVLFAAVALVALADALSALLGVAVLQSSVVMNVICAAVFFKIPIPGGKR